MKTRILSIITTAVLLSGTISIANGMGNAGDPAYNDFMVKMADTNADGTISKEEFMDMAKRMAEEEFRMMDMDDDDKVTKTEFHMANR